jgi:hypothetical protein
LRQEADVSSSRDTESRSPDDGGDNANNQTLKTLKSKNDDCWAKQHLRTDLGTQEDPETRQVSTLLSLMCSAYGTECKKDPPKYFRMIMTRRPKYACRACAAEVTPGPGTLENLAASVQTRLALT